MNWLHSCSPRPKNSTVTRTIATVRLRARKWAREWRRSGCKWVPRQRSREQDLFETGGPTGGTTQFTMHLSQPVVNAPAALSWAGERPDRCPKIGLDVGRVQQRH